MADEDSKPKRTLKQERDAARYAAEKATGMTRLKAWRLDNRERNAVNRRLRHELTKAHGHLKNKEWRLANAEHLKAYRKAWRLANAEAVKAYKRANRLATYVPKPRRRVSPEQAEETKRRYAERNCEKVRARVKAWKIANRDRARANSRKNAQTRHARLMGALVEVVDPLVVFRTAKGVCGICKMRVRSDQKWHLDHILPLSKGGVHSYDNVQVAHSHCNVRKHASIPRGQLKLWQRLAPQVQP